MTLLKIVLIGLGITFCMFGYLIYFKKKYNLINGFESDYKAGSDIESYARRVGLIELGIGVILIMAGIILIIVK
ncbi:DUF3784 domain-containing protein [Facklamia sp. P12945]